ncbi:MAG: HIT family protein, partial [Pseudomonas sp.]|nr:HIT family protein [Pseudomonas sp.]
VIVRRRDDVACPAPVWGRHPPQAYTAEQVSALKARLRLILTEGFCFAEG